MCMIDSKLILANFLSFFRVKKKISPRLPPRRKSCRCLITACSRENLPKNMLRVGTIIRHSRASRVNDRMMDLFQN